MGDVLEQYWRVSEDAIANMVGGEAVILHLGNGTYYGLDTIGSLLWEELIAGKRPSDVCKRIANDYGVDRATVESDLRQFLAELVEHDLIERI